MPNFTEEARIVRELTRAGGGPDPFSSAVRATRMPMLITDARLDDNPIVFANAAFARLTGYDREAILGRNCRFLQGPDTDRAEVARLAAAIADRETIELDLLNYRADGTTFWNRLLVSPVFDEDGTLTYFFASQLDVTLERERLALLERDRSELEGEVARRTLELVATEQRLRFALEAGRLGVWSIDLSDNSLSASDQCKAICGRQPDEPLTLADLRASIHTDDLVGHVEAIDAAIANRTLLDTEYRVTTPAGEERWVQIRGEATYAVDGTPLVLAGTTQDITARRLVQEQRVLQARELGHRVKNTLAVMQGMVSQTLRRAGSIEAAEDAIRARIQAMAAAHDLLVRGDFGSISMRELIERTLAPFGVEDAARFTLTGPDLELPQRLVTAYALGLHELATNSVKYGALSVADGGIDVSWSIATDDDGDHLHLTWSEHGGPAVAAPAGDGFGTRLLRMLLAKETGGRAEVEYRASGVLFTAVSPLAASTRR
ncbi:PAS domain-containing protein [Sphingomonas sp. MA1305]|uniref:HWE histidine kinase domain-containing protein n=1 Tax=Sphingomonas sp. MA1305 TaxID=2479204 RepID=UPI001E3E9198|nr:PAS domain-containing protein [Sphingomonas sp. MA1305]MBI0476461.1 PAS domain-containing protein [Sphingomonas sp. MA1305]